MLLSCVMLRKLSGSGVGVSGASGASSVSVTDPDEKLESQFVDVGGCVKGSSEFIFSSFRN